MRFLWIVQILVLTPCFADAWRTKEPSGISFSDYISQINHFSIIEGAGSLGSYLTKVSLGGQFIKGEKTVISEDSGFYLSKKHSASEDLFLPQITIQKGLSIPVNLGVSYGALSHGAGKQWAGFVQWSFFERVRWPALAFRFSLSKITGMEWAQIDSKSLESIASYGFLRYFQVFASMKASYHKATWHTEYSSQEFSKISHAHGFGLEVAIMPPYTSLAIEQQNLENQQKLYYGKISRLL